MKRIIQLEEFAQMALGIFALQFLPFDFAWWIWPLVFLSPDISIVAYAANNKTGAFVYNLFHHRGIAIALAAAGFFTSQEWLLLSGVIMFSHASFDRLLGYGLKYTDGFEHTHLRNLKEEKF